MGPLGQAARHVTGERRILLGIDCSSAHLALALVDPELGVLAAGADDVGRAHAALVIAALEALFERAGIAPGRVGLIGVGVGPGSYTGVRVGVATATGLGRAWGVPVAGASSLVAVAGTRAAPGEEVVAVMDARRGNVYAQRLLRREAGPSVPTYDELEAPRKLGRAALAAAYPGLRVVEGAPPDAAVSALAAVAGRRVEPYYL